MLRVLCTKHYPPSLPKQAKANSIIFFLSKHKQRNYFSFSTPFHFFPIFLKQRSDHWATQVPLHRTPQKHIVPQYPICHFCKQLEIFQSQGFRRAKIFIFIPSKQSTKYSSHPAVASSFHFLSSKVKGKIPFHVTRKGVQRHPHYIRTT